jgi:hypothetical protein
MELMSDVVAKQKIVTLRKVVNDHMKIWYHFYVRCSKRNEKFE